MESTTPIKRHPSIVSFSKDHHFALLLVWKIRQGLNKKVDCSRISNYVLFFFKEDLAQHFKDEEEFLFSRLPVHDILRTQAEDDHKEINDLVASIGKNNADAALLSSFAGLLEKHIRFEERELFNHLQENIPEEDLEKISLRLSGNHAGIAEQWEDNFWEKQDA